MEALVHEYCVWLHFFNLPPNTEREKNHLNVAYADNWNQTRAACTANQCAIHYSIASCLATRSLR